MPGLTIGSILSSAKQKMTTTDEKLFIKLKIYKKGGFSNGESPSVFLLNLDSTAVITTA